MAQYFKQVFAPNIMMFLDENNNMAYYTSRPIKKGEPLTIHSLSMDEMKRENKKSTKNDQELLQCNFLKLKSNCKENCKCTRCTVPTKEDLASDPDMNTVLLNVSNLDPNNREDLQELVNNLDLFSRKRGP